MKENVQPLLGLQTCDKLQLVQRAPCNLEEAVVGNRSCMEIKVTPTSTANVDNLDADVKALLKEYEDVFTGLGKMPGELHIDVDPSVPSVVHAPRSVAHTLKDPLKKELDRLEEMKVIERISHPTDWVNSLVVVKKPNGKEIRVCLDPNDLNRAIRRPHHIAPTGRQIADKLAGEALFTVFDLKQAYHQVELDDESADRCAFNTPYGRYRYLRMPFGIKCASDVFQHRNEQIFGDIEGVEVISDELLLHSVNNKDKHLQIMRAVLEAARRNNVTLNKDKIQAMCTSVKYMGDIFTSDGIRADPNKIQAIVDMSAPEIKKELRSFLGIVNFIAYFTSNLSQLTLSLRSLLKHQTVWIWDQVHDVAFEKLKSMLTSSEVLSYFDPNKHSTLQVDASMK